MKFLDELIVPMSSIGAGVPDIWLECIEGWYVPRVQRTMEDCIMGMMEQVWELSKFPPPEDRELHIQALMNYWAAYGMGQTFMKEVQRARIAAYVSSG
jgi:hypothetical protein